ncbi:MAG: amidohydrolase family protein [Deltaproteobacteria bacterium]|nr:amidohydrolase family protein [Deltaproteobacteria bacterium]
MEGVSKSRSASIRAKLDHPIIDSDGHTAEFEPVLFDYLRDVGGSRAVDRLLALPDSPLAFRWYKLSPQERREQRQTRPHFWVHPAANTLDRATSSLPKLLYERLDEIGLDFTIVYPSIGLFLVHLGDDELRGIACRALNKLHADTFREYADRMTPVAVVPMHSPAEAIAELEYAVRTLGLKAALMPGYVRRPITAMRKSGDAARHAFWLDLIGLDSEFDYDPLWKKCVELGIAPTFHSGSVGLFTRNSISNFTFNHIGHFAAAGEAICKALFFGGVTRRFPGLTFSFLEGGAAWGCALLADLVGHWEKHNADVAQLYNPATLDQALLERLFSDYAPPAYRGHLPYPTEFRSNLLWGREERPEDIDEWALCGVKHKEDIRDLFVPNFFFGCEGDDSMTALAFDTRKNAFGARLNVLYSSDLGHYDLPDMRDAAKEAWELVEHELISEQDFREFVFVNPVLAKTRVNPDFFTGTVVENAAARLLNQHGSKA